MVKLFSPQNTGTWAVSTATGCPAGNTQPWLLFQNDPYHCFSCPRPSLWDILSNHLTTITNLSSSYLTSTPPPPSTPFTVPQWKFTSQSASHYQYKLFPRPSKKNFTPVLGSQFTEAIAQPPHCTTLYCWHYQTDGAKVTSNSELNIFLPLETSCKSGQTVKFFLFLFKDKQFAAKEKKQKECLVSTFIIYGDT